jgi:hypothetical protein
MPHAIRTIALWLALTGLLGMSVASASPAHEHFNNPARNCSICFAAHLSVLQPVPPGAICAPEFGGRAALPMFYSSYDPLCRKTSLTRGPPCC